MSHRMRRGVHYDPDICHICKNRFTKNDIKCVDHNHITGVVRGLAHKQCNLNYRNRYFIPVVIHNSKNYDTHFILKKMSKKFAKNISIIPCTTEKFIMFTLDSIRFIDSFQFLNASLESLVENLNNSDHEFKIFNHFYRKNENIRHLLKRKGVFPYNYFDRIEKLNDPQLPSKDEFFNVLTNTPIDDEEYRYAQLIFKTFKCQNLGDYLELYQNCDVILLAEVFQEFRRKSLENFELDPVHFITSAQLTFNAGLKMTKVELKLLHNVNDYLWFEKQIRGGICFLTKRYVRANNPLIPALYDSSKPCNYILPLDVVNLYGSVMLSCLPEGNFSWLSKDEISKFNVFNYGMESNVGYFVECDLK